MTDKQKKYLFDIFTSTQAILTIHLKNIYSLDDFAADLTVMRAVERELEIIGEAAKRLSQTGMNLEKADSLVNRRNTIIHQYDGIQARTIWQVCQQEVPPLQEAVKNLLDL